MTATIATSANVAKVANDPTLANVSDEDRDEVPDSAAEIHAQLRAGILDGSLRGRLPTREALATRHGVSVWTIGRVIDRLKAEGLVVTRGGRGTWVVPRRNS